MDIKDFNIHLGDIVYIYKKYSNGYYLESPRIIKAVVIGVKIKYVTVIDDEGCSYAFAYRGNPDYLLEYTGARFGFVSNYLFKTKESCDEFTKCEDIVQSVNYFFSRNIAEIIALEDIKKIYDIIKKYK